MAAATSARPRRGESRKHFNFTLAATFVAVQGTRAMLNPLTSKVQPATAVAGLIPLGMFDRTVDASLADKIVGVDLEDEIWIEWFENATAGDAVTAADVGKPGYHLDNQTISILSTGKSPAGLIAGFDADLNMVGILKGVAIPTLSPSPAVAAFAANDYAPATLINGAVYDIPTTAGVSTVTLPAAAPDGSLVYFQADGVKNGHTVQYRDATGPVNLTSALVALKRHLAIASKRDGKWAVTVTVAP